MRFEIFRMGLQLLSGSLTGLPYIEKSEMLLELFYLVLIPLACRNS